MDQARCGHAASGQRSSLGQHRQPLWRLAMLAGLVLMPGGPPARAGGPLGSLVQQWRWQGIVADPMAPMVLSNAVVAQLTDDDGDGLITGNDTPDVAFLHSFSRSWTRGSLTVLDGLTGTPHWTASDPPFGVNPVGGPILGTLAAGDLDSDGVAELVVTDGNNVITCQAEGTCDYWRPWPRRINNPDLGHALGLADFDQDGVVEVYSHDRVVSSLLSWVGPTPAGLGSQAAFSQAADLVAFSPGLELLVGNTLHDATGRILWQNPAVPEGATAIGDLDGDGSPEIVLAWPLELRVLDIAGNEILPVTTFPYDGTDESRPSAPLLADLDADGLPEIVLGANDRLLAYDPTPVALDLLWSIDTEDRCCGGATAFDFDGDGSSEVVYYDQGTLRALDGRTGAAVLSSFGLGDLDSHRTPVVADIDRDGAAEILISGLEDLFPLTSANSLFAYEVPGSCTPRAIWNQRGYHVTNVNDDGTIPRIEQPAWLAQGSWHAQVAVPRPPSFSFGEASVADPSTCLRGLLVSWDPAVLVDPARSAAYAVYRSDSPSPTCEDALLRPPLVSGLSSTSWLDRTTLPGRPHAYVVEALPTDPLGCEEPQHACVEPSPPDVGTADPPAAVFATLRASHRGDDVTLSWPDARPLLPGEAWVLLKGVDGATGAFLQVNPPGDSSRSHAERDASTELQLFDLRAGNACGDLSEGEYPGGG